MPFDCSYMAALISVMQNPQSVDMVVRLVISIIKVKCARFLLEAGAKLDASDINKNTPLHYAASYGRKESIALLLDYGASLTLQNKDGRTPYEVAKFYNRNEVLTLL
ncbi:uncharacterized protein [Rutidosis leptorrhynchoides]|uniref:uncharacterized protein isoform X2 n=1 Tax=Rutidosis leptorrhynchoides TaxID=125765 RepID=UPI003A997F48